MCRADSWTRCRQEEAAGKREGWVVDGRAWVRGLGRSRALVQCGAAAVQYWEPAGSLSGSLSGAARLAMVYPLCLHGSNMSFEGVVGVVTSGSTLLPPAAVVSQRVCADTHSYMHVWSMVASDVFVIRTVCIGTNSYRCGCVDAGPSGSGVAAALASQGCCDAIWRDAWRDAWRKA